MHCPNCGARASRHQKFCRSCGLNLGKVYQLLAEELSTAELNLRNKLHRFEHWRNIIGVGALSTVLIVLLVVLIREIASNIKRGSPELWPAIIGFTILIGMIVGLSLTIYSAWLRDKLTTGGNDEPVESSDAVTTAKLPPERPYIEVASVTEGTTDILGADGTEKTKSLDTARG